MHVSQIAPGDSFYFDESTEVIGAGVITAIDVDEKEPALAFTMDDGSVFELYHEYECCESVCIDKMDIDDLKGAIGDGLVTFKVKVTKGDDVTHTFVDVATKTHTATVAFKGESNGFYSETISMRRRD